jgi:hypothetical protein
VQRGSSARPLGRNGLRGPGNGVRPRTRPRTPALLTCIVDTLIRPVATTRASVDVTGAAPTDDARLPRRRAHRCRSAWFWGSGWWLACGDSRSSSTIGKAVILRRRHPMPHSGEGFRLSIPPIQRRERRRFSVTADVHPGSTWREGSGPNPSDAPRREGRGATGVVAPLCCWSRVTSFCGRRCCLRRVPGGRSCRR